MFYWKFAQQSACSWEITEQLIFWVAVSTFLSTVDKEED